MTRTGVLVSYDMRRRTLGGGKPLPLRELPDALAELPPRAWPYGRWILLTEPALGAGDDEPRVDDVDATRRVLERLGVEPQGLAI